jgi:hypothetical protein
MRQLAVALLVCAACSDHGGANVDAPYGEDGIDADPLRPATLAGTGLCVDLACTQISADVHEYTPQFGLWSDTATKRRWMYLPPGTTIDTSNMDFWVFPVGTKFWKEFTRDGTRVETRYITKLLADDNAPNAWFYVTYAWDPTQDDTTMAPPSTGIENANGTQHDIPSRANCKRCHEGIKPSRVLGFQAIQLDYASDKLDLDDLISMNMLSVNPAGAASPHFGVPVTGLPGSAVDRAALGYMHANCGHCHNPTSSTHDSTPLELRLETTKLGTVAATPAYTTAHDVTGMTVVYNGMPYTKIWAPTDPDHSLLLVRLNATTSPPKMPEIGTEMVDPAGDAAIRAWVMSQ